MINHFSYFSSYSINGYPSLPSCSFSIVTESISPEASIATWEIHTAKMKNNGLKHMHLDTEAPAEFCSDGQNQKREQIFWIDFDDFNPKMSWKSKRRSTVSVLEIWMRMKFPLKKIENRSYPLPTVLIGDVASMAYETAMHSVRNRVSLPQFSYGFF